MQMKLSSVTNHRLLSVLFLMGEYYFRHNGTR